MWNGDGLNSWREDDPKLLCIKSDLDIDGLLLNLVGPIQQLPLNIEVPSHQPTFVDLGSLPVGSYLLHHSKRTEVHLSNHRTIGD